MEKEEFVDGLADVLTLATGIVHSIYTELKDGVGEDFANDILQHLFNLAKMSDEEVKEDTKKMQLEQLKEAMKSEREEQ